MHESVPFVEFVPLLGGLTAADTRLYRALAPKPDKPERRGR